MKIIISLFTLIVTLNFVSFLHAEDKYCEKIRKLNEPQPQFQFETLDDDLLKVKKVKNPSEKEALEKTSPDSGNYYFLPHFSKAIVFVAREYSLELSVPEYGFRPISFEWINPKLIYIDISFNPNRGAYWIYDVEQEKVIHHELEVDGWEDWERCTGKEYNRDTKSNNNNSNKKGDIK